MNIKEFIKQLDNLGKNKDKFFDNVANSYKKGYLKEIKQITPVVTGNIRRNYYATKGNLNTNKGVYVQIYNKAEYSDYVDKGHRARGGKAFVNGQHMSERTRAAMDEPFKKLLFKKYLQYIKKGK